jgi:hypothetical protein
VTIYHISSKNGYDDKLALWLDGISDINGDITVIYVDSDLYPDFYRSFTDSAVSDNSIVVVSNNGSRVIRNEDLYLYGITFMDNVVAEELNYDTALRIYNSYFDKYLEDYGINVSGYITYYPTHYVREEVLLSAMLECTDNNIAGDLQISPISLTTPNMEMSQTKQAVSSIVFILIIPAIPLAFGAFIIYVRKKSLYHSEA